MRDESRQGRDERRPRGAVQSGCSTVRGAVQSGVQYSHVRVEMRRGLDGSREITSILAIQFEV